MYYDFSVSTATSATALAFAEYHIVMVLQKCCSGDSFNRELTFQYPKNNKKYIEYILSPAGSSARVHFVSVPSMGILHSHVGNVSFPSKESQ